MSHVNEGLLLSYLDGEMAGAERSALEVHLAACESCRALRDELGSVALEVHAALIGADMVAGTASAFRAFTARREALGGAPVTAIVPDERPMLLRWTAFGAPLRVARASLLKAAALALVIGGAAGAAIPGSPLRQWIEDTWRQLTADPEIPVAAPERDVVAPAAVAPARASELLQGPAIAAFDGSITYRLLSPDPAARIRVRFTDSGRAFIWLANPSSARYRTGNGWMEISNLGTGDLLVDLPRSVSSATIEVNGRVILQKTGSQLATPGQVVERTENEVVFRPHS
jgi:anti-sigma factor RsiW